MRSDKSDRKIKQTVYPKTLPICLFWMSFSLLYASEIEVLEPLSMVQENIFLEESNAEQMVFSNETSFFGEEIAASSVAGLFPDRINWTTKKKAAPPEIPVAAKPTKSLRVSIDALYFKPIQDSLKYGQTNSISFSPPGNTIGPSFTYDWGVRGSLAIPLRYDDWDLSAAYTYFHPTMPTVHKTDDNQYLFMVLTQSFFPQVNNFSNVQCGDIKGKWRLKMDLLNIELKRICLVSRSFLIKPIIGIQLAEVKQRIVVNYGRFWIVNGGVLPLDNPIPILNAQKIISANEVYGVGPEFGGEMSFLMPKNFRLFLKSAFACMFGRFNTTMKYAENLGSIGSLPPNGTGITTTPYPENQVLKVNVAGSFTMIQIQGAFSKEWKMGKNGSGDFMLGWETQFWWNLSRMNGFNQPSLTSLGADMSLQGPYARLELNF
ncbi:MAG TPA: hypothetical protein DCE71_00710 [Parachlamydiales bacterium]|nr:hypothetical protein [Parachlamydiales bacterium]